jgi:hypothetical protein
MTVSQDNIATVASEGGLEEALLVPQKIIQAQE